MHEISFLKLLYSTPPFKSTEFDGIVGLGSKELMNTLNPKSQVFSVYVNSDPYQRGHIKFGGYDKMAYHDELVSINMKNKTSMGVQF
jgi:hypothetical protein